MQYLNVLHNEINGYRVLGAPGHDDVSKLLRRDTKLLKRWLNCTMVLVHLLSRLTEEAYNKKGIPS